MKTHRGKAGWWLLAVAGLFVFILPAHAEAHAAVQGMGELVGGFLHPLLTPPHVLVLLSLGLLFGQSSPTHLKLPVAMFVAAAAAGLIATATARLTGIPQSILVAIGWAAGGMVALALPLPPWVCLGFGAVAGLALGLDSGVDPGTTGWATAKTLFATWVSLFVWLVNVAFYSARLPTYQWVQTGVRVVGSWIVAIAFLMLAFSLRR